MIIGILLPMGAHESLGRLADEHDSMTPLAGFVGGGVCKCLESSKYPIHADERNRGKRGEDDCCGRDKENTSI
ncbi:MAG TPA: hypothetical protein VJB97_00500 [Candidatus Paceibacterota bacterium]